MAVCNGTMFTQECELLTPAEATRALFSKHQNRGNIGIFTPLCGISDPLAPSGVAVGNCTLTHVPPSPEAGLRNLPILATDMRKRLCSKRWYKT